MAGYRILFCTAIIAFSLAWGQGAQAENYISMYTTGEVTEYVANKTIEILDEVGDRHTYLITADTEMPEKIEVGMTVEVSSEHILAHRIENLSE